ncbi:BREX-1 system adenine-specific DNA-methyltransferase PglX [Marinobacter bryozoorum]|uniref:BREX-1 system adenine-specific DNA-methyltransferase PglX n=2 Tax=Gammaproteobacteria TaxID=1236 RepID=UPI0020031B4A|nr:BREX-1 system adenine-specific DNA-methyltransferase PglX [Marinobacter bryozoorum]MCK7545916.1 BREX-1 system adenine-specific DNA-methyltransferase PglX [Marinobacter bryozoorum]
MQPLDKTLRNQLERAVKNARDTAETGARAALDQLGVADPTPAAHLSETERELRRRLRAHGRQLGDSLNGGKVQSMDRLVEEVAYEHWHRMLFARFLAENDLLMYPDPDEPVAITLEECEDLAADEGAANGWELAARYAARMLPQIFRLDSPVFQLTLPPEHQQALERQVAGLPLEVFTASDSLGWVYQFWQARKKEQVNQSEVKIGARELPAVTQLFTEPYMVSFLLDNSLGAWWAARQLSEDDLKNAESEEDLRQKAAIPGVPLEYLRFVKQEDGAWTPAAGTFDAWPEQLADLKTLDPCCGSGHFLVAAFLMLVPMRMERDGLSARDAVNAVLRENIHGLELDQRCVELAAFALALTAWKYPGSGGYRDLPELHVACSGLSISTKKSEWLALAGDDADLENALEELYEQFSDAPILGSLINPERSLSKNSLFELEWDKVIPLLTKALSKEYEDEKLEIGVVAKGVMRAAMLLSDSYGLIFTNPPYLVRGKQSEKLQEYLSSYYSLGDPDIATVFLKRFDEFLSAGGTHCSVTPLNWYYLRSYKSLRLDLLENSSINNLTKVGSGATAKASWDVLRAVAIITKDKSRNSDFVTSIEAPSPSESERSNEIKTGKVLISTIENLKNMPDSKFAFVSSAKNELLEKHLWAFQGLASSDFPQYGKCFWEVRRFGACWVPLHGTFKYSEMFSGLENILLWEGGQGRLANNEKARIQGLGAQNKSGIVITQTRQLPASIYLGGFFDNNVSVLATENGEITPAVWCFCASAEYYQSVRKLDEKLGVTNATLAKVPFDLQHWTEIAKEKYPHGLPKPYTNNPTQWIFHGHPCGSVVWDEEQKWTIEGPLRTDDTVLQVAVARLLGYRWPAELDPDMELADEQRELVKRCEALLPVADEDGIVCIPPVRGEASAADRLLNLLAAAYGDAWSTDVLAELLKSAGHAGKTLETWLRDKFFTQHCKLFENRPFIWHIWDGLPDGFSALVNYHKLDRKNLETLVYTYLGDWIGRQKQDKNNGIDGAEERLAAAEALKKKLEQILEGEAPYDIFVRWKPIDQQPIGWEPDLNDGVRLNIRPFMTVADVKKNGAGILRDKPNIKWTKDRGKDVESAPWYQTFGGERINDHHLNLAEKQAAREQNNKTKGV